MKHFIKQGSKFLKLALYLIPFLFTTTLFAQTSWKGTTSTSWSNSANWTAGVPTASVDAIIGDANFTGSNHPTISGSSAKCKSLTLGNSTKASTLSINKTLTVSGNILIGTNGTINHNTSKVSLTGNWTNSGTYTSASANSVVVIFAGTSQSITGASSFYKLTINATSTTILNSAITVRKTFTVNGTFDPSDPGYLVTLTGGGVTFLVNANAVLRVRAATFAANYSINPTTLNASSTIDYASSTTNQTIAVLTYGTLRISGTTIKTPANNITLSTSSGYGNVNIASGTLNLAGFTMNKASTNGSFTIANGATLQIGSINTFPSNYTTYNMGTTSTVEYNGTAQTVTNRAYGNLTLSSGSGAATKTMPGTALTIANDFTSTLGSGSSVSYVGASNITVGGNMLIGASTTFDGGSFTHTFNGNFTNNGTFTGNASTAIMNGTGKVIAGTNTSNFFNLTIQGYNVTASAANISVSGNLSTTGSGTFFHNSGGTLTMSGTSKNISGTDITLDNLTVSGTTITTTSSLVINGSLAVGGSFSASGGTIQMAGASKTISGAGTLSFNGLRISGTISTAISFSIASDLSGSGKLTATANIITFNGTSTFAGTHDLFNVTLNGTKLQLGTGSAMGVANTLTLTAGTFDVTTTTPNTVNYNGSGAQSVKSTTYNNLSLSTGGTKTAAGALTINNNLAIYTGATFDAASFTHSINGNFANSGTFTASTSTIQLLQSLDASITGVTTFNILTINKSASSNIITLNNNINVATLNMTSGQMRTGANSVTITTTRTGPGIILGTITRTHTFASGTDYEFEGPSNTINFASLGTITSVSVNVTAASVSGFPLDGSINRVYTISVSNVGMYFATLKLHYEDTELNGNSEATMSPWHYSSSWSQSITLGSVTRDGTANWVAQSSIGDISNTWTLSDNNVTAIWKGTTSSAWELGSNWKSLSVPSTTDIIEIGTETFTNQPTINSAITAKAISFGSVKAATLTINSGSLSVNGNVKGIWSANATHQINMGNQNLSINGDLNLSDGTNGHRINVALGTGTLTILGSLYQSADAALQFTGAGSLNIAGDYNFTAGTFTASSGTVNYNGTFSQVVAGGITYNNLVLNKSAGVGTLSSAATLAGNLTLSTAATFTINAGLTIAGNVSINSGTTFNGNSQTLNVAGNWVKAGTFNASLSTVNFNGSSAQTIDATTFNNLTITKSAGTISPTGNLTVNDLLTLTSGTFDLGTYTVNRATTGGIMSIADGATLKIGGASNFPANYNQKNLGSASFVDYNGTVGQSIANLNYGNLSITNGVTKTLSGTTTVLGNLTINSGATLSASSYSLTIQGNITNSGTFTPATSTIILTGTSKLVTGTITFNNIIISGSYTVSPGTTITVNGYTDLPGTFIVGNNTINIYGNTTIDGTYSSDGLSTYMGTQQQTIRLTGTTTSPSLTSTFTFAGTVAPVFNSTAAPTFVNVNINNTGAGGIVTSVGWVVLGSFNVATNCTFNGGSLTHSFYKNITNNGTVISSGTLNFSPIAAYAPASVTLTLGSGPAFASTGIVNFGGTQAITINGNPTSYGNVVISNTNAAGITAPAGWTLTDDLTVNSGSVFNAGSFTHTLASSLSVGGTFNGNTSTVNMTSVASDLITGNGTIDLNNLTITGTLVQDADFNIMGNYVLNGSLDVSDNTITFTGSSPSAISGSTSPVPFETLVINKTSATTTLAANLSGLISLSITSGTLNTSTFTIAQDASVFGALSVSSGGTLKIGGTNTLFTFTNGYTFSAGSTVEYGGTTQAVSPQSYSNLTLSNANTKTFSGTTNIAGDFTISGTATGDAVSNTTTINFNGVVLQSTPLFTYYNLNVNNANGISLAGNATVNNTAAFTLGKIFTNTFKVILGSSASISGETNGMYLIGFLEVTRNVGTGSSTFGGIGLSIGAGVENLGNVTVLRSSGPGKAINVGGMTGINRSWDITITGTQPASGRLVTFSWIGDDDNGKNLTAMQLYSRETSTDPWAVKTSSTNVASRSFPYTTTHFSSWTASDLSNTLPVTLINFKGLRVSNYSVDLSWATASESNNSGFSVEKSENGKDFIEIGFVKGKGESDELQKYFFSDNYAYRSAYYRLKQIDFDGEFTYGPVVHIDATQTLSISVYPNPVKDQITIVEGGDLSNEQVSVSIISDKGQHLIDESGTLDEATVSLNKKISNLPAGIYYFSIATPAKNYVQRIVKL